MIGLFDVDTNILGLHGDLILSPKVDPVVDNVRRLLAHGNVTIHSMCIHAGIDGSIIPKDAVWIPACGVFPTGLAPQIYLEKVGSKHPDENICTKAYDPFICNPHTEALVMLLPVSHWIVFGCSLEFCIRATIEGLVRLGKSVSLVTDATVESGYPDPDGLAIDVITKLGVSQITTEAAILRMHGCDGK